MRILKLLLIFRINEELTKIFKVEDKGQFKKKRNSKDHPLIKYSRHIVTESSTTLEPGFAGIWFAATCSPEVRRLEINVFYLNILIF